MNREEELKMIVSEFVESEEQFDITISSSKHTAIFESGKFAYDTCQNMLERLKDPKTYF